MLTSLSSSCYNLNTDSCRQKYLIKLPAYRVSCRSSFHHEGGRQASMVDKNMGLLRERVEKMKLESDQIKQREISQKDDANVAIRRACRYGYVYKHKKHESMALVQSFKMLLPIYGGLGLALLAGFTYALFLSISCHLSKIIGK